MCLLAVPKVRSSRPLLAKLLLVFVLLIQPCGETSVRRQTNATNAETHDFSRLGDIAYQPAVSSLLVGNREYGTSCLKYPPCFAVTVPADLLTLIPRPLDSDKEQSF